MWSEEEEEEGKRSKRKNETGGENENKDEQRTGKKRAGENGHGRVEWTGLISHLEGGTAGWDE